MPKLAHINDFYARGITNLFVETQKAAPAPAEQPVI